MALIIHLGVIVGECWTKIMSKFTDDLVAKIERYVDYLAVPEFSIEKLTREEIPLENLQDLTNKELEEQLSLFGGYKSYLEAQLGLVEAKRGALEASLEALLTRTMYKTEKKYTDKGLKKPTKDSLKGEAVENNEQLQGLTKELIQSEALSTRVKGLRDAYSSQYAAVSRVIALRATVPDQI